MTRPACPLLLSILALMVSAARVDAVPCADTCGSYAVVDHSIVKTCSNGVDSRICLLASVFCCDGRKYFEGGINTDYCSSCDQSPTPTPGMGTVHNWHCDQAALVCGPADDDLVCDGRDNDDDGTADEGCLDGGACDDADRDGFPVRFSSGRVEANPIAVVSLPTQSDAFFGVALRWGSHQGRHPGATVFSSRVATDFFGTGWLDAYGDRLLVAEPRPGQPVPEHPTTIHWQSFDRSLRFDLVSTGAPYALYAASAPGFELRDYGAGSTPRYRVVRSPDLKVWEFAALDFTSPDGNPGRIGVLSRIGTPGSTSDLASGYGVALVRDASGRLLTADDTDGRRLTFITETIAGLVRVARVELTPQSGTPVVVARFEYGTDPMQLARIDRGAHWSYGYHRFRYWHPPAGTPCPACTGLISEIITPRRILGADDVAFDAEAQPFEQVIEGHRWQAAAGDAVPRAIGSYGPGESWAYRYDDSPSCHSPGGLCTTAQIDLADGNSTTCSTSTSCTAGLECWYGLDDSAGSCHAATYVTYERDTRRVVSRTGHLLHRDHSMGYDSAGRLRWSRDADGLRTTFSYDAGGELGCVVRGDDDDDAGQPPACAPPADGQAITVAHERVGTTETIHTPSQLPGGGGVVTVHQRDGAGRLVSTTITGSTRTVSGETVTRTRTWSYQYASTTGRLILAIGPDDGPDRYDRVEYSYHPGGPGRGRVFTQTRYAGTPAAAQKLLTRFEFYDAYGVPWRTTYPDGAQDTLTISDDRMQVIVTTTVPGAPPRTRTLQLDPDGRARSITDADGVCESYEHRPGLVVQRRIAAGAPGCGSVPIDITSGEVELRYLDPTTQQVTSIRRRKDGVLQYREDRTYDDLRRLQTAGPAGGPPRATFGHGGGVTDEILDGHCPGELCGRVTRERDLLGRPSAIHRFLGDGSELTTHLLYDRPSNPLPTAIERGRDGASTITTRFDYDDFGQLIEARSPDTGTVRWERDGAGRERLRRDGVGTTAPRTTATTYDGLGRVLAVDHDLEHPVDCATASAGTPVMDEEYRYESCDPADTPQGFSCTHATGRRTMARTVLGCLGGQPWSRATWFAYDAAGRVVATAIAERNSGVLSTAYVAAYEWSPAGRATFVGNPLSPGYGTAYAHNPDGTVAKVAAAPNGMFTTAQVVATPSDYVAFGRPRRIELAPTVRLDRLIGLDDAVTQHTWSNGAGTSYMSLNVVRDGNGAVLRALDAAAAGPGGASKVYRRDELHRLRCEGVGLTSVPCQGARSKYTYASDDAPALPPDNRRTAAHTSPDYAVTDTYVYASGSNRLDRIDRGEGLDTVYGHDPLGRRTFDADEFDAAGRRDYTYLPNGRLGSITGHDPSGRPYQLLLFYDTDGRVTMTTDAVSGATQELFYDLDGRLIAARRAGAPSAMVGASFQPAQARHYTWYSDGTYAIGTVADPDQFQPRRPFALPAGKSASSIVGVAHKDLDLVVALYADGTGSIGSPADLGAAGTPFAYSLPAGQSASDVVGVAINWQGDGRAYAWYRNKTYSSGSITDLDATTGPVPYTLSAGKTPDQILAMDFVSPTEVRAFLADETSLRGPPPFPGQQGSQVYAPAPGPGSPQRWAFHYLDAMPVAATREIVAGSQTYVKRLMVLADERGIPHIVRDGTGVEHFRANYEATGWRRITTQADFMWLPFALPAQVILETTAVTSSCATGCNLHLTRPPLALNRHREYDPMVGRFLEPDPLDVEPREDPEGYAYGRNDPSEHIDPSGQVSFSADCSALARVNLANAVASAIQQLSLCAHGQCLAGDRKDWITTLASLDFRCDYLGCAAVVANQVMNPAYPDVLYPVHISNRAAENQGCEPGTCLSRVVAHEALHVIDAINGTRTYADGDLIGTGQLSPAHVTSLRCTTCPEEVGLPGPLRLMLGVGTATY